MLTPATASCKFFSVPVGTSATREQPRRPREAGASTHNTHSALADQEDTVYEAQCKVSLSKNAGNTSMIYHCCFIDVMRIFASVLKRRKIELISWGLFRSLAGQRERSAVYCREQDHGPSVSFEAAGI